MLNEMTSLRTVYDRACERPRFNDHLRDGCIAETLEVWASASPSAKAYVRGALRPYGVVPAE